MVRAGLVAICVLGAAGSAAAQAQTSNVELRTSKLLVTVADPSGGVIPGASVTVVPQDAAARTGVAPAGPLKAQTSTAGIATADGLAPGRYTLVVEFPGFETVTVKDHRLRAGENKRTVMLPLKKVAEDVVVGRDKQTAGLDPRGNAFSTVLTREQIAALPDDPDEMEAALKAMAPPGAVMRVDGFTGGKLPPKSQIRSIRLPRMDQMAAQNHGGITGMMHIDVMTQPGAGPLGGSIDFGFRDDALNARNPFTPVKGDEGMQTANLQFSGSILPNKSSFSVGVQQARLFDSGNILAAVSGGTVAQPIRRPTDRTNINGRFDQAFGDGHLLKFSYQRSANQIRNVGVGSFDLLERAYQTTTSDNVFRVSENGAVGRRGFSESRLQLRWSETRSESALEAPTVRVLDAFTSGGAQRRGGNRAVDFEAATDFDYVRGVHSMRAGVLAEGGRYRSDDASNYVGTYTFASLADYAAGRPSNYTRRTGDPSLTYSNLQVGAYWQDDWRVRKSLLLSYGVRYEAQTLIQDQNNVSPRATVTWSPFKSGRTSFRAGAGWFNDWLGTSVYEQALRVDGVRQQEVNVLNPTYPDPGSAGSLSPSNRYQLSPGLRLPSSLTMNAGVDQSLTASLRVSGTYTFRRSGTLLRGRNVNAPVDGLRPDPSFSNVVEVVNDAGSRTHQVGATLSFLKLNWKQTILMSNYTWTSTETNTTGPFSLPANGDDLSTEWGPAAPTHRMMAAFNMQPIPGLGVSVNFRAQSGSPYTVTAGRDLNGDGIFNDRPASVGRNTETTAGQWDLGARVSYSIGFGTRPQSTAGPGGVMIVMGGGGMAGGFGPGAANKRFQIQFYAAAQNVTNRSNYIGYSGVVTSPFFGQPTNVLNPRKTELGVKFVF
jgi:hypothetical protein